MVGIRSFPIGGAYFQVPCSFSVVYLKYFRKFQGCPLNWMLTPRCANWWHPNLWSNGHVGWPTILEKNIPIPPPNRRTANNMPSQTRKSIFFFGQFLVFWMGVPLWETCPGQRVPAFMFGDQLLDFLEFEFCDFWDRHQSSYSQLMIGMSNHLRNA